MSVQELDALLLALMCRQHALPANLQHDFWCRIVDTRSLVGGIIYRADKEINQQARVALLSSAGSALNAYKALIEEAEAKAVKV